MKRTLHFLLCLVLSSGLYNCQPQEDELKTIEYVDPFMSQDITSHGKPETVLPFGAVRLAAQTVDSGTISSLAFYNAADQEISPEARALHFLPVTTAPTPGIDIPSYILENHASFHSTNEQARPGYYAVQFDNGIKTESAVTKRCCIMYYQYPQNAKNALLLNLLPLSQQDSVKTQIWKINNRTIEGFCKSQGTEDNRQIYFVIEFSQDCQIYIGKNTFHPLENNQKFISDGCCLWIDFGQQTNKILVKASLSTVNTEGAAANLEKELSHWSFDKVERDAKQEWKRELQNIKITGENEQQLKTFYTKLYLSYMTPAIFSDVNGNYNGPDGEIHSAHKYTHYAVCPPWNDWEDIPPLLAITQKKKVREMLRSSQNDLRFSGAPHQAQKPEDFQNQLLTAIGLAPSDPDNNKFQLVAPIFERTVIHLGQEKRFVITVTQPSEAHIYIEEAWLNKRKLDRLWLTLDEIMQGGKLNLILTDK